ncbi:DUF4349 domain-containing protein [Streptomyces spongiicola]|uniref:DUF4349 domain-containing protein n=1 Tax=Streptomyces spongiicola TaxID=1690221 RepID=A0A388SV12_9ACTN|nr:DUF4349 domain-containing protein [Streptomyces spongiicola]GBP98854.1 DUF4349 domain-containing protein [Streptomyces spongiicola]
MRARHRPAAALLVVSLSLAGCGASDDGSASTADRAAGGEAATAAAPGSAAPGSAADASAGAAGARVGAPDDGAPDDGGTQRLPAAHVIRTAELAVEVKDAARALAQARTAVEQAGGHVADESTERVDEARVESTVVLRVPQDRYAAVLARLSGAGELLSRKADAKDVTDQVVDVESRVATQRASVARVRALMDRATRLSDVVTLEGELSRRQAELESLLARQASLEDRTSMATITLRLSEPGQREQPDEEGAPGFLDALSGGWGALASTARWVAAVVAAAFPFGAALALLYAVWRWVVRPLRTQRAARGSGISPSQDPGQSEQSPGQNPVQSAQNRGQGSGQD